MNDPSFSHGWIIYLCTSCLCVCLSAIAGYTVTGDLWKAGPWIVGGFVAAVISVLTLRTWIRASPQSVLGGAVGFVAGVLLATVIFHVIEQYLTSNPQISLSIYFVIVGIFALFGVSLGSVKAAQFSNKAEPFKGVNYQIIGIVDTSVIIDGRIADIFETGFLCGTLIIPQFILQELQTIADSSESTKRTRGRRGLDILKKMQKQSSVKVIIDETDYPSIREVDQKLIQMAKEGGYSILTNDYNLNKVAEVHSIKVLNVNQLANALKPVVLPGETLEVHVMREGKEPGQGVAYLEDGTMVVIDNGKKYMARDVEVTVTSVLQTTAGRMIFATKKG